MGSRSRQARPGIRSDSRHPHTRPAAGDPRQDVPVVGLREPCPCGSGKRYKSCHGRDAARAATALVERPFEGLRDEAEWVALREIVPAGTAPLRLAGAHADREVTAVSVLPTGVPALVRADARILLALQAASASGDPSRDLAAALELALHSDPGALLTLPGLPGPGPRLQDLVDPAAPFEVSVHDGFDFWVEGAADPDGELAAGLAQANSMVVPSRRVAPGAYWCRIGDREHVRWVVAEPEERLLDALARLHGRDEDRLTEGSRLLGTFRAHGLLVPVWDVAPGTPDEALAEAIADLGPRLAAALADDAPLGPAGRRARAGLANRQVTLR